MGLFGDYLGSVLGGASKPSVPKWTDITLADEQQKAIDANKAALPGAEELTASANAFTQDQILKMLRQAIPNYDQLSSSASGNILSLINGQLPKGVSDQIQTSDAARALGGGFAGSGMGRNLVARDLGLSSLQLTQQGLSSAERWLQTANSLFAPNMMNVASMFVSPQQMFSDTMANQENKWGVQWLKNQIKAMPDPQMEALGQFIGGIGDAAASYFVGAQATQRSSPQASNPPPPRFGNDAPNSASQYDYGNTANTQFASGQGVSGYTSGGTGFAMDTSGMMDLGGGGAAGGAAGGAGGCCFIFLESYNGKLPWWVRECRDEYYKECPQVARGYKRMAKWLVPLMKISDPIRDMVNRFMVAPLTKYGGWSKKVKGYETYERFSIYKRFWFTIWKVMGR